MNWINEERSIRVRFIWDCHLLGMSNKEITKLCNDNGILKPSTKDHYSIKDVWSVIMKHRKRLKRMTDTTVSIGQWEIVLHFIR